MKLLVGVMEGVPSVNVRTDEMISWGGGVTVRVSLLSSPSSSLLFSFFSNSELGHQRELFSIFPQFHLSK